MKKTIVLLVVSLWIISCTPTDKQIKAALEETQTAQPTLTLTVLPTLTPTITPSPTLDFAYIEGLSFSSLEEKFRLHDAICEEKVVEDDGSFESSCNGVFDGGIIKGTVSGFYDELVVGFSYAVIPYIGTSNEYYVKGAMVDLVDFGLVTQEKQTWVVDAIDETLVMENDEVMVESFPDVRLVVTSVEGFVGLVVTAKE